ncbi:DUF1524 domain-containing protein [Leptospira sp. WS4.C2]
MSKDLFIHNFSNNEFNPSDTRTKYILWRLENLSDATSANIENINTEHIMPKTLTTEWKNSLLKEIGSGADDNKLKIEYDSCINKIGNLTLLEHRWNKKIKQRIYCKGKRKR